MSRDSTTRLTNNIAYIVSGVWAISFIADIALLDKYDPNPLVHIVMMGVVGGIFGRNVLRKNGGE